MRSRLVTTLILFAVLVGLVGSVAVPQLPAPPPAPAPVDDRGILEMQLASYDPEQGAIAQNTPLPEDLVGCLDDVLWDLDWPRYPDGVRFALTTPFEAAD